ncbi:MAG TPA: alpha/beta hydrolase [Candidatus Dormibacteraeota bacterium]
MTRLAVINWGTGDRVAVLIHGLSSRAALWGALAGSLAERGYRVVAPDLRGHGRSPRGHYSVDEWVADLLEVVPAEPDLAVGHSLGGVLLAVAVPSLRPRRAVYIDPPWIAGGDTERRIADFESRKHLPRDAIARANPDWTEEETDLRHEGFALWDETTARAFVMSRRSDYTPSGPPRQPSLLVLPEVSPLVPRPVAERMRMSGWAVEMVPRTGHYVHLDDRSAFLRRLVSWLETDL